MNTMEQCRACKGNNLFMCLPMGSHPPANGFVRADQLTQTQASFPLNIHVCLDCALIQVPDNVPAGFFRNYVYVPSASETMHAHFSTFAAKIVTQFASGGLIVDIGCNDGLFLGACKALGAPVLGIDPADNITVRARQKGIEVVPEYFGHAVAASVARTHQAPSVIVTTNTFNHIGDLHDFMAGVASLLDSKGAFVVEVPSAIDLIANNEFDTVYHEHVSEFSVKSFVDLYHSFDMEVFDIEALPIHGGSMRVYGQHRGGPRPAQSAVREWLERERREGLFLRGTYEAFRQRVHRIRDELMRLLSELKSQGKKLAGYGAPAKGNTLLNFYGIGPDLLDFLADRNELKHGLYSPGMLIPVVSTSCINAKRPDYLLILAWNFADEIIAQQDIYRQGGGKFIIPIPEPTIIE
jgi:SAM-dependent methyltransferase